MRIALLEDDLDQARLIAAWLEAAGHGTALFSDGQEFIKGLGRDSFDCVILDWMLPGMNGIEVLKWLRAQYDWPIPVLFVTQREAESDVVAALESGADDYMAKPVKERELLARLTALRRRSIALDEKEETSVEAAPYRVDLVNRQLYLDDEAVKLTRKEYELVVFFLKNTGRILSRSHILESVWGTSPDLNTRTVDTHVSRIRSKLKMTPEAGWRLSSIYQHGYRLERLQLDSANRPDSADTANAGVTDENAAGTTSFGGVSSVDSNELA